jgi:imidazolonepropionase-like amidohydrolase
VGDFVIRDAALLDPVAGEVRPGASLRVEGERIVEVAEDGRRVAGDGLRVVDAGGRTLMPGLIDAHVHAAITTMDLAAMGRRPATLVAIEARAILERMLRRGFTTVRDAAGLDAGLATALERGLISGPRVFRSGRCLSQTGGHGDHSAPAEHPELCACRVRSSSFSHVADGVDAVRKAAREELRSGIRQLKVMAGGGVASPSDPIWMAQYTEAELRAAVEEAAAWRTYVLAHAYVPEAIQRAVRAGVRSIEHGNLIDAESAKLMAERGAFLVPTLVTYEQIAAVGRALRFPEASLAKVGDVLAGGLASLEIAAGAGVPIGFGTDLLGETHDRQSDEFLIRARVQTPLEVIRSATVVNAELLGLPRELGRVAPGAFADLLLVDGDPLRDLSLLTEQGAHLPLIVRGGEIVVDRT